MLIHFVSQADSTQVPGQRRACQRRAEQSARSADLRYAVMFLDRAHAVLLQRMRGNELRIHLDEIPQADTP